MGIMEICVFLMSVVQIYFRKKEKAKLIRFN